MIKMAVLAPKGIFEDEEVRTKPAFVYEEPVRVLLHDDFARGHLLAFPRRRSL